MASNKKEQALNIAVKRLLRPLVKLLLRNGVSYGVFADLVKTTYVDVAFNDFSIPGKKQTDSRVATITGLTRKEVYRIKNLPADKDAFDVDKYNRAARVVYGWVHDPEFSNNGNLRALAFDNGDSNFSTLVKAYSGDVPPRAILDELLRVGVVDKTENGEIFLKERAYIPKAAETEKLHILGVDVSGLISTIDRNIYSADEKPFFQRKVYYDNLSEEAVAEIRDYIANNSQELLEKFDQKMSPYDRDINPNVAGEGRKAAGVSIFYFEEDFEESEND
ncbi:MAG: DUF6502 family protein [Gammaproteobacteria bacterium]|nr:DUF6502 family protein [Gammaproteobacteria bacterium]